LSWPVRRTEAPCVILGTLAESTQVGGGVEGEVYVEAQSLIF
jgi:hypothetical protein